MSYPHARRASGPFLLAVLLIVLAAFGGNWGKAYGQTGGPPTGVAPQPCPPASQNPGGAQPCGNGNRAEGEAPAGGNLPANNPATQSLIGLLPEQPRTEALAPTGGTIQVAPGMGITFPAGAVNGAVNVTFAALSTPTQPLPNGVVPLLSFTFDAFDANGNPVSQFGQPYTMGLSYDPDVLRASGFSEDTLTVAYFNTATGQWVAMQTTVDQASRTITVVADHFTEFAIVAGNTRGLTRDNVVAAGDQGPYAEMPLTGADGGQQLPLILAALMLLAGGWFMVRARKRA